MVSKGFKLVEHLGTLITNVPLLGLTLFGENSFPTGTDVGWWRASGVPTGSIANHNEHYFYFHHSDGDTMTVLDPHQMDLCSAVWTAFAYVLADMDDLLPRD